MGVSAFIDAVFASPLETLHSELQETDTPRRRPARPRLNPPDKLGFTESYSNLISMYEADSTSLNKSKLACEFLCLLVLID